MFRRGVIVLLVGLAVCCAICASLRPSRRLEFLHWRITGSERLTLAFLNRELVVIYSTPPGSDPTDTASQWGPFGFARMNGSWGAPTRTAGTIYLIFCNSWVLAGLFAAYPTYALFRGYLKRKITPGLCDCGYNLTGNLSGVCPECGIRIDEVKGHFPTEPDSVSNLIRQASADREKRIPSPPSPREEETS